MAASLKIFMIDVYLVIFNKFLNKCETSQSNEIMYGDGQEL